MEQENNNEGEQKTAEDLAKSQTSEKKGPNSSKAKSDIVKSMAKNFLKTRKAAGNSDVQSKKQKNKNKTVSEGSEENEENAKKLNSREENQQKDATAIAVHVMSEEIQKNEENKSDSQENGAKPNKRPKKRRREEEPGVLNKNWKSEKKHEGKGKTKQNEQKEKHSNTEKNNRIKEKHRGKEKQQETKKEKIDGLIFMCNAKTKPDCFRYRVMGVTQGKKDVVLGIKRGIKLFLYDYDLKLMYGIYKASSSGGMKLEPKAFGGDFPAQVRFSVHADCFPLAESIFKKAIKENYNQNNKFKTELTARQVRKLTELFRPVAVHPTALPMPSPSRAGARIHEHGEHREVRDRARAPSDREASARDPYYASIGARSYSVLSQERDQQIAYGELASTRREDNRRDLYLNEKEYRAYGLQGERRNLTLQHSITPTLASYPRDYGEQLPRQLDTVYREPVPLQRDGIRSDPLYLSEREYRPYEMGASTSLAAASTLDLYATDSYRSRYYGGSLVESYLPRPRGEAPLIETNLWRRENNELDKLQPAYASDALADYNQMHRNQDYRPEAASTSVSSRYSFGGASLSYR
ncbi:hypothetical protein COLO4_36075 [Corchorus olitorius]|uniref:DCD domain-containing protein n=1 Tax=Corchorus olitorius TaxID=93759 RepID=A0A1R3GB55_9ROSI|nr:hypothetical protein COLO4_36075 [Corchorus olitorius]